MRKLILTLMLASVTMFAVQAKSPADKIVLAYITAGNDVMPDPDLVTHVNYAFGIVKPTFDGVNIQNPDKLRAIVEIKKVKPSLKIMLSIGGWGSGGFSEMACVDSLRAKFVEECKNIVEDFKIDGIDMDWEYPSSKSAGIHAQPEDVDNFTKLITELRAALGKDKLLTFASPARARFYDFKAVMPIVDFINIMAYDMGRPPRHNAALFPSEMSRFSAQESIDNYIAAGVPVEKLVLGVPLYGHGDKKTGHPDYVDYRNIGDYSKYTHKWDKAAQVPYVVDENDNMIVTYDNPKSLKLKCKYALKRGLLGVMYWEYACDDPTLPLVKTIYKSTY